MSDGLTELWDIDRVCAFWAAQSTSCTGSHGNAGSASCRSGKSSASGQPMWPPGWKSNPCQLNALTSSRLVSDVAYGTGRAARRELHDRKVRGVLVVDIEGEPGLFV
jgi:hypothetical protein